MAPKNGTEFIPVIQAYANLQDWNSAADLTRQGLALTGGAKLYFCSYWQQFKELPSGKVPAGDMLRNLNCPE
jgi:hypothetical protein